MILVSYKTEWFGRDRDGNKQYHYVCNWSDGTTTEEVSLPWDKLAGAVDLDRVA